MSRKIKFHSLNVLFKFFSFLADKTGGWQVFVKPKLIIGSLIIGLGLTGCGTKTEHTNNDKLSSNRSDTVETNTRNNETVSISASDSTKNTGRKKGNKFKKPDSKKSDSTIIDSENSEKLENNNVFTTCYVVVQDTEIIENTDENKIYQIVENMPEFPGGFEELFKFISSKISYKPFEMCYTAIYGKVICRFIVEKDGSISNIEVVRSIEPVMDKEAIRIIQEMPKWIPGKQKGKVVRTQYFLPINFKPM